MSSAQPSVPPPPRGSDDRSTRARIRDAAIRRVATDGLDAPLRAIAADAGVSAALIMHHFGSRSGLQQVCHDHVMEVIEQEKSAALSEADPRVMFAQLAAMEEYAPVVGYALRCLQAGGPVATRIVQDMVERTETYLEHGVRAGTVRPSRDPRGRARLLCYQSVGVILVALASDDGRLDLDQLSGTLRQVAEDVLLPALELYTEPLLTDRTLLDAVLAQRDQPPSPHTEERS